MISLLTKMAGGSVLGLLGMSSLISFATGGALMYGHMHKAKVQAATNAEVLRLTGELSAVSALQAKAEAEKTEQALRIGELERAAKDQKEKIIYRTKTITKEIQADESPIFEMRLPAYHVARRNCLRNPARRAACYQDAQDESLRGPALAGAEDGKPAGDPDSGGWQYGYKVE